MPDQAVAAPKLTVASWRRLTPEDLRGLRHELRAHLLSVTNLPDQPSLLTKGAADEPVAALAVAAAVRDTIEDEDADLVWSWVTLAAVSGKYGPNDIAEVATIAVAARLLELSAMAIDRRRTPVLRGLALRWADLIADGLATSRIVERFFAQAKSAYVSLNAFAESLKPHSEPTESGAALSAQAITRMVDRRAQAELPIHPKTPVLSGTPTLVVAKEIALGRGGGEDRALVSAWGPLTEPMPLAGGTDPKVLEAALALEFPWLTEAIRAVVDDLTLRRQAGMAHAYFRPILLVGPPGSGKSRFARRLAGLLGVGHGEVNAGGSSDNRLVAGTARGWSSASPAYILHVMRDAKCANPLIFVDEIDKAQASHNGDLRATLLTMIGNAEWPDECLMSKVDLSQVSWVFAANDAAPLKGPLLTRLRVVPAPKPGPEHAEAVLASVALDMARELGLPPGAMPELPAEAKAKLHDAFVRGHSLRRIRAAYEGAIRAGGGMGAVRKVN